MRGHRGSQTGRENFHRAYHRSLPKVNSTCVVFASCRAIGSPEKAKPPQRCFSVEALTSLEREFLARPSLVFLFLFGRFLLCWHVSSVNDFPLQGGSKPWALDSYHAQLLGWAAYLVQDIAVYYP